MHAPRIYRRKKSLLSDILNLLSSILVTKMWCNDLKENCLDLLSEERWGIFLNRFFFSFFAFIFYAEVVFDPRLDSCRWNLILLGTKGSLHNSFYKENRFSVGKSKMSELSRTEFLGLSVDTTLDLRFSGTDVRIWSLRN